MIEQGPLLSEVGRGYGGLKDYLGCVGEVFGEWGKRGSEPSCGYFRKDGVGLTDRGRLPRGSVISIQR